MKAKGQAKVQKVLHEFKEGSLHSGSPKGRGGTAKAGPLVTDRKQAIAIALSEARQAKKK